MQRHSKFLILGATLLLATIGGYWLFPPPRLAPPALAGESETVFYFSIFLLLAASGSLIFPMIKWCGKRHAKIWGSLAGAALALSVLSHLGFEGVKAERTVLNREQNRSYLVGVTPGDLEEHVRELENYQELSNERLLVMAAWEPTDIWSEKALLKSRWLLTLWYLPRVPLFALCLMCVAQLISCAYGAGVFAVAAPAKRAQLAPKAGRRKIFFSYSRADSQFCLTLAEDLKRAGFEAWIDQRDIAAGAQWDSEVEKALREANTVLVVLSPDSVCSRNVLDEASFAIDEGDLVIPVLHRPCEVPLRLRRLQYVDFTGDYTEAFEEFCSRLEKAAGDRVGKAEARSTG